MTTIKAQKITEQICLALDTVIKCGYEDKTAVITSTKLSTESKTEFFGFHFTNKQIKPGDTGENQDGSVYTVVAAIKF
jgi:hypothetical protein